MLKRYFFIFIAFFCIHISYSQKISIIGKAPSYSNYPIEVWTKKDFISNSEKKLTESEIDSSGLFTLEFECHDISYVTLKIEKNIASLFVQPNSNYDVIIGAPDSATYRNTNIEHDVDILINIKSKTEINALTIDFDKRFDEFLTNEYPSFVVRTPKSKIDSFKTVINEYYKTVNNPYFKNYITYSIASLEAQTYSPQKKIYTTYIENKPVLYNNTEYFNLFNSLYKGYLQHVETSSKKVQVSKHINNECDYYTLNNILKSDDFLKNDTIRELVILKGLQEGYFDGSYKKDSVLKMLSDIIINSNNDTHKSIAQNIISSFSKLRPGADAPFFELPDKNGLTHSLNEIRAKKQVYLVFFQPSCTNCQQQLKIISSYKKKYGKDINFIGISEGGTMSDFKNFCAKNPQFDWLLLYDNTKGKLAAEYEIKTYPTYYFINPEGKFIQAPADTPENFIERAFIDISKPKPIKGKVGAKKNK
jgi:peroxiredoxin